MPLEGHKRRLWSTAMAFVLTGTGTHSKLFCRFALLAPFLLGYLAQPFHR
jgi:hypothetical protein